MRVEVLSAATIRAVSDAFSKVGLPDATHPNRATAFDCGGLTHQAWDAARVNVPANDLAQWQQVHSVPVRQVAIGDTVFFHDGGSYNTGVFVGKGRVIAYDTSTGEIAVRVVPRKRIFGADRPTLPTGDETSVKSVPAAMTDACTTVTAVDKTPVAGVWGYPVAQGSYTLSAGFGQGGGLWSSGAHTGQDFAASIGTPVFASRAGTVSLEKVAWAGELVRIAHGGGVESLYAHMSRIDVTSGQQVKAGELIGAVGDRGNTTGPHLHFEIRIDDRAVDPMPLLDPSAAQPSYGGNGQIAEASLCPVAQGTQMLRCDAAVDYRLMDAAFEGHFGVQLCITDSYRSLQVQQQLAKTKPRLAAVPGTSNHGWGLAVDLCGGVDTFATPEHQWLVANAPRFGWDHPAWAEAGGNRPEPWHFEYAGGA
jgi:murein DD-endopeptidase MepM/ murein hydrolase activator NlpD